MGKKEKGVQGKELRFAALTTGMMDLKDWENQSIVDASRLDLSSPVHIRIPYN
jgi:hypothetical protein